MQITEECYKLLCMNKSDLIIFLIFSAENEEILLLKKELILMKKSMRILFGIL